jgi:hypothetical protein
MLLPEEKSTCIFLVIRTAYHQARHQQYFLMSGSRSRLHEDPSSKDGIPRTDLGVNRRKVMFADGGGRRLDG